VDVFVLSVLEPFARRLLALAGGLIRRTGGSAFAVGTFGPGSQAHDSLG
jgi:hypothetical protein